VVPQAAAPYFTAEDATTPPAPAPTTTTTSTTVEAVRIEKASSSSKKELSEKEASEIIQYIRKAFGGQQF